MQWTVHGERVLYRSPWVGLSLVDVEVPGGERFDHHVVRVPRQAVGVVVHDRARDAVLLLWRHRFITGTWGWEVPAGGVEQGEPLAEAAAREVLEETGWRCGPLRRGFSWHPSNGCPTSASRPSTPTAPSTWASPATPASPSGSRGCRPRRSATWSCRRRARRAVADRAARLDGAAAGLACDAWSAARHAASSSSCRPNISLCSSGSPWS
jgi:8-oxo-dGTP pyrophosphatase MutT (NUDIX family)